jgi:hypothetical protein
MKESFTNLQDMIDRTKLLSDMELQAYLSQLSESQRTAFIASQVGDAVNSVKAAKEHKFLDISDQARGADIDVGSAMYYLARTRDLQLLATDADKVTVEQLNVIDVNRDLSVRQHEINEWSNQNKLDTLYFLQLLFVGLCFIAILLFLKLSGIISPSLFSLLTVVTGIIIVVTVIIRARFTYVSRDSRYWHKARFPKQPDTSSAKISTSCPS